MTAEVVLFHGVFLVVVGGYLMVLRPFRAGRRPAAIYDQLCTYLAIFGLTWFSAVRHGSLLWATGVCATLGAVAAGGALDRLLLRIKTENSLKLGLFYAGSGLTCFAFTWMGGWMSGWLFGPLGASH